MFISTVLTKWESHRDSKSRVGALDLPTGRTFLLNPNRMKDIRVNGSGSKFLFYDNNLDSRENACYVESASSVAELRASHDDEPESKIITLSVYRDNRLWRSTYDMDFLIENIAYIDAYNPDPTKSWVVYIQDGFKRVELLVTYSLVEIFNLMETGDITGVVQYVEFTDGNETYRKGVRDGAFVLDKELTVLGFGGIEDTDWENIRSTT